MTFTNSPALIADLVSRLAARRRALNKQQPEQWSQTALDAKLGWADGLTSKYEAAMRLPSLQALTWWAQALGVDLNLDAPKATREEKRAAALTFMSNGATVRDVARMLILPPSTVGYWRKRAVQISERCAVRSRRSTPIAAP